ncbi:hypothetical protein QN277_015918 [Acacia crassicarpa]|uniref:Uncharacterized protein n=1 Tax=Acacia crassicarpa TaxID=499986 RepID=A0AAE1KKY8_9FABA|nr:hypothetical protein QN277_015918 [Acacia crassicarpa]
MAAPTSRSLFILLALLLLISFSEVAQVRTSLYLHTIHTYSTAYWYIIII